MKKLILIFFALLSLNTSSAQQLLEYEQSPIVAEHDHLIIHLDTNKYLQVNITKQVSANIQIMTSVKSSMGKKGTLEYLKKTGRYQLEVYSPPQEQVAVLKARRKAMDVFINGRPMKEVISYTIHLPENMTYEIQSKTAQQASLVIR